MVSFTFWLLCCDRLKGFVTLQKNKKRIDFINEMYFYLDVILYTFLLIFFSLSNTLLLGIYIYIYT